MEFFCDLYAALKGRSSTRNRFILCGHKWLLFHQESFHLIRGHEWLLFHQDFSPKNDLPRIAIWHITPGCSSRLSAKKWWKNGPSGP
jgi:hypothetical protein